MPTRDALELFFILIFRCLVGFMARDSQLKEPMVQKYKKWIRDTHPEYTKNVDIQIEISGISGLTLESPEWDTQIYKTVQQNNTELVIVFAGDNDITNKKHELKHSGNDLKHMYNDEASAFNALAQEYCSNPWKTSIKWIKTGKTGTSISLKAEH